MKYTQEDSSIIAQCIHELESRTQAEVVLVVRRFSGNYRDLAYLFGFAVSLIVLVFLLVSPVEFNGLLFPVDLLVAFGIAARAYLQFDLVRFLSKRKRRFDQVMKSARACFHEKEIYKTHGRIGVLIYYSMTENRAVILADTEAAKYLPADKVTDFEKMLEHSRGVPAICEFLRSFGVYLGRTLPCEAHEKNELSETPELNQNDAI